MLVVNIWRKTIVLMIVLVLRIPANPVFWLTIFNENIRRHNHHTIQSKEGLSLIPLIQFNEFHSGSIIFPSGLQATTTLKHTHTHTRSCSHIYTRMQW